MAASQPMRRELPLILIRGFGGLGVEDEKKIAYQGFNDGTVYPHKRGENYIYEGLILRFLKSGWKYQDATNIVGYYGTTLSHDPVVPQELLDAGFDPAFFSGSKVVIDPAMALNLYRRTSFADPARTLWVFRYYDLDDRQFPEYGRALVRLIDFIAKLAEVRDEQAGTTTPSKVNILAHSMGGLIARYALQCTYEDEGKGRRAEDHVNKIVTLGTPHQGISFQVFKNWIGIGAENELEAFNPAFQNDKNNRESFHNLATHFPPERLLTVVGTNYRSYAIAPSSWLNRLFSAGEEFGPNYNRSDGLVKQAYAQIPDAPRTFVHKCHGGVDSLVTARESFEIATRFFFGDVRARLRMVNGRVTRGYDLFGKSEFFFGISIKPRRVDFDLFHQSVEAENCYGPFSKFGQEHERFVDFSEAPENLAFAWAGPDKLIWEGWLDTSGVPVGPSGEREDMVIRLDFYVGERDLFGIGFSDNVVFRKQYYIRALLPTQAKPSLELYLHADERFAASGDGPGGRFVPKPDATIPLDGYQQMERVEDQPGAWRFRVEGTGFEGIFQVEIDYVPPVGEPEPFQDGQ